MHNINWKHIQFQSDQFELRVADHQNNRDVMSGSIDKVTENSCNDQYILYPYSIPLHIRISI